MPGRDITKPGNGFKHHALLALRAALALKEVAEASGSLW
jgi:hypothetical protein